MDMIIPPHARRQGNCPSGLIWQPEGYRPGRIHLFSL